MKKRTPNLLITATLLLALALARTLHAVPIPEPILPLREAGEYVQRIEELRKKLNEKDGCNTFSDMSSTITDEIDKKRYERSKDRSHLAVLTRSEFAALEWVYYLSIFLTPTTPAEVWEGHWDRYYGQTATVLGCLPVMSDEFLEAQKIDANKLRHNRALYQAILLKKLRGFYEAFEDENLGMKARGLKLWLEDLKTFKQVYVESREFTEEERKQRQDSSFVFRYNGDLIRRVTFFSTNDMKRLEDSFFFHLIIDFPDSPKDVENYLKLSGRDTEGKRAVLLLQSQKASLKSMWHDRYFSRYAKKIRFNPKEAEKLAKEEEKRLERELEARKKKWEQYMKPLLEEEAKLQKEIKKEREEWLKANPPVISTGNLLGGRSKGM